MLFTFDDWAAVAAVVVLAEAGRQGWQAAKIQVASTGTRYLHLRHASGERACVRLADHRATGLAKRRRLFSVRQAATGRLRDLGRFLGQLVPHRHDDAQAAMPRKLPGAGSAGGSGGIEKGRALW